MEQLTHRTTNSLLDIAGRVFRFFFRTGINAMAFPMTVFLTTRPGHRTIRKTAAFLHFAFFSLLWGCVPFAFGTTGSAPGVQRTVKIIYLLALYGKWFAMYLRARNETDWHSLFPGIPLKFLGPPGPLANIFFVPTVTGLIACVLCPISPVFLMSVGFMPFVSFARAMEWYLTRETLFDLKDQALEARFYAAAQRGDHPSTTAGVSSLVTLPPPTPE